MHDHHVIIEAFNAIQDTIYKSLKNMQTQPEFLILPLNRCTTRYLILQSHKL